MGRHKGRSFRLLPDEVLELILGNLEVAEERHRAASRVCKQWARLCSSPTVLKRLHINLVEVMAYSVRDAEALYAWLALRAAQHTCRLHLGLPFIHSDEVQDLSPKLAGFATLTHLSLELENRSFDSLSTNVLTALGSLRHLRLKQTAVPACLGALTQLQSLHLQSATVRYVAADEEGLEGSDEDEEEEEEEGEQQTELSKALPQLQKLTTLVLVDVTLVGANGIPVDVGPTGLDAATLQALDRLPRLQRLVHCKPQHPQYGRWPAMPVGAWAGRLRWMGLSSEVLLQNPQVLQAATQLERLYVLGSSSQTGVGSKWHALWDAAAGLPSLQHIELHPSYGWAGPGAGAGTWVAPRPVKCVRSGLAELQRRRPQLTFCEGNGSGATRPAIWEKMFDE